MSFAQELYSQTMENRRNNKPLSDEEYGQKRDEHIQKIMEDKVLQTRMREVAGKETEAQFQTTVFSYNINDENDSDLANLCHPVHRRQNRMNSFLQQLQDKYNEKYNNNADEESKMRFRFFVLRDRSTQGCFNVMISWGLPKKRTNFRPSTRGRFPPRQMEGGFQRVQSSRR
jgi:hypothetical protein